MKTWHYWILFLVFLWVLNAVNEEPEFTNWDENPTEKVEISNYIRLMYAEDGSWEKFWLELDALGNCVIIIGVFLLIVRGFLKWLYD